MAQIIIDMLAQGYDYDEIVFELEDMGFDSFSIAIALENVQKYTFFYKVFGRSTSKKFFKKSF